VVHPSGSSGSFAVKTAITLLIAALDFGVPIVRTAPRSTSRMKRRSARLGFGFQHLFAACLTMGITSLMGF